MTSTPGISLRPLSGHHLLSKVNHSADLYHDRLLLHIFKINVNEIVQRAVISFDYTWSGISRHHVGMCSASIESARFQKRLYQFIHPGPWPQPGMTIPFLIISLKPIFKQQATILNEVLQISSHCLYPLLQVMMQSGFPGQTLNTPSIYLLFLHNYYLYLFHFQMFLGWGEWNCFRVTLYWWLQSSDDNSLKH